MAKIGLYFGSFNPIHNGHLSIANYCVENYNLDMLYFIVSPHNPLKEESELLPFQDRVEMVSSSIESPKMEVNVIEDCLPKPSYTINTLKELRKIAEGEFYLILGLDNWLTIHQWKNLLGVIGLCDKIIVIPRDYNIKKCEKECKAKLWGLNELCKSKGKPTILDKVIFAKDSPLSNLSSSFIRQEIRKGHDIIGYVHGNVRRIIKSENFYLDG